MGGRIKREGIYVYLYLIHIIVQQELTQQHGKAIILHLKKDGLINYHDATKTLKRAKKLKCKFLTWKATRKVSTVATDPSSEYQRMLAFRYWGESHHMVVYASVCVYCGVEVRKKVKKMVIQGD